MIGKRSRAHKTNKVPDLHSATRSLSGMTLSQNGVFQGIFGLRQLVLTSQ